LGGEEDAGSAGRGEFPEVLTLSTVDGFLKRRGEGKNATGGVNGGEGEVSSSGAGEMEKKF